MKKVYVFKKWLTSLDNKEDQIEVEAESFEEAETKAKKFTNWTMSHQIHSITKWKKQTELTP